MSVYGVEFTQKMCVPCDDFVGAFTGVKNFCYSFRSMSTREPALLEDVKFEQINCIENL